MKLEDVKRKLRVIEHGKYDDELSHIAEDELLFDFIKSIENSNNLSELKIIAKEVMKVRNIEFERWHA
jgi:uncharacterized protein YfkK (UPF0435 family)